MLQRLSRLSSRSKSNWASDEDLRAHGHAKPTGILGLLSLAFASIGVIYGWCQVMTVIPSPCTAHTVLGANWASSILLLTMQFPAAGDIGTSPLYVFSTIFTGNLTYSSMERTCPAWDHGDPPKARMPLAAPLLLLFVAVAAAAALCRCRASRAPGRPLCHQPRVLVHHARCTREVRCDRAAGRRQWRR